MIRRDMAEVLEIEDHSFEFPWTEKDFIRCLRQRNCIGMVAETLDIECPLCTGPQKTERCQNNEGCDGSGIVEPSRVVGFMIYELYKTRLHVLSIAVHRDCRRHGVASTLIDKLKGKVSHQHRDKIRLETRERNIVAQNFFKSQGFKAIQVLKDFYEDTTEDAYVMEFRVQDKQLVGA
jgi:ribosomal-protein-alanine N-acetyltransferase